MGGNKFSVDAAESYIDGGAIVYIVGETVETIAAIQYARDLPSKQYKIYYLSQMSQLHRILAGVPMFSQRSQFLLRLYGMLLTILAMYLLLTWATILISERV